MQSRGHLLGIISPENLFGQICVWFLTEQFVYPSDTRSGWLG
jgi:hypothetical protein